jgi:putative ABC transport system ATP-binding protein
LLFICKNPFLFFYTKFGHSKSKNNFMLEIKNLTKTYNSGSRSLTVLDHVSFKIEPGETFAIVGPSGSGKTTLLGLCAGLDRASEGSVILNGIALDSLSEDERAEVRNKHVGFIFQNFQLIPTLTALENVMIPLELRGDKGAKKRAEDLLERVGLTDRKNHYPTQLSGGEQQRVSLARAFSNNPKILFADEPTGNLDEETSEKVEALLFELNRDMGTTLVLVTHDLELAAKTQKIIKLRGGKLDN